MATDVTAAVATGTAAVGRLGESQLQSRPRAPDFCVMFPASGGRSGAGAVSEAGYSPSRLGDSKTDEILRLMDAFLPKIQK